MVAWAVSAAAWAVPVAWAAAARGAGAGIGVGGGNFDAGMNGVIGPAGLDSSIGFAQIEFDGQLGPMRAGPLPYNGSFGDVLYAGAAPGWFGWNDGGFLTDQPPPSALAWPSQPGRGRSATTATNVTIPGRHRAARKSASRRPKLDQLTPPR